MAMVALLAIGTATGLPSAAQDRPVTMALGAPLCVERGAWSDCYEPVGEAVVEPGLRSVKVCDFNAGDDMRVGVKYATSFLFSGVIKIQAPQGGCESDSVIFGRITHVRFCYGVSWGSGFPDQCHESAVLGS
ncbi:hypothetical protein [Nonomuraea jabiensis]|uniref:hypothetical protein n=1 Tax=Nonomuraea jabiensis TaxID=882448 RepID=UPI003D7050AF